MKNNARYDPEIELAKGTDLTAASYDKTRKVVVINGKVTIGGAAGRARISGTATGRHDGSIDGTMTIHGQGLCRAHQCRQKSPYKAAASGGGLRIVFAEQSA